MDEEPLIAVRIKDGIFVGNAVAAHDEDFLFMNKVTHVINCAGAEVSNLYGGAGVEYLTFGFRDAAAVSGSNTAAGVMFDPQDKHIEQVARFIDRALDNGECVMVHCTDGVSRSCAVLAAYFVVKYGWKVNNTLSFLQMAHQDMEIAEHWLRQLRMFGKRHAIEHDVYDVEVDDGVFALDNDQWMLRNTLLNGLSAHVQENSALFKECAAQVQLGDPVYKPPARRRRRLIFVDTNQGTAVGSLRTNPVVKTDSGKPRHADPHDVNGSARFSGMEGVLELQQFKKSKHLDLTILARHSTPHRRRLESQGDVNAKGRQQLTLRRRAQAVAPEVRRTVSGGSTTPRLPTNAPIVRTVSGSQQATPRSHADEDTAIRYHPQESQPPVPRQVAEPPQRPQMPPSHLQISRQHIAQEEDRRPLTHSQASPLVGESRHMAPSAANMRPTYSATGQRTNSAAATVGPRTPFALSSASKPRVGSPLPQQRRAASTGSSSTQQAPLLHTARKTSMTGPPIGYGNGSSNTINSSIYSSGSMRPASPAQRVNSRPSSPTVANRAAFESSLVRRASSPLQHSSQPGVPIRRGASPTGRPHIGGGASVVQGASGAASSGTIQPTIRRANSPMQRTSIAGRSFDAGPSQPSNSTAQRPSYVSNNSVPSSMNRSGSGIGTRPSSPMQRGPMPAASSSAVRPNSPSRGSLADQYLRGGSASGLRQGTPTAQPVVAAGGGIKRGVSPMQRRY